jgi:putative peptidoglycan lipid II flippase
VTEPGDVMSPPEGSIHPRRRTGLAGATLGMAVGTTISRATGVGRLIALNIALGTSGTADAYNLANTTPNIITDIVIGGVLSATFVPVFVDRLTTRRRKEAWRAISAVTTATVVVLIVASVAFWFLTPAIIDLYTVGNHNHVHSQQRVAVGLLRWFVPQLACYGAIALFTALLNARRKFAAPMFVPIANNLAVIAALLWFHVLVPHPSLTSVSDQQGHLVLLGLGTTLGVVIQALLLIPSLKRADLHLRVRWEPGHEAIRTIVRLAGWTFALVIANQVALVVILALADPIHGAVSAYTYAYTFFQLPYGVVAVSVMSAVTPSLSARWALGDVAAFRRRMAFGLRGMLAIIIPSAVGMLILAHPLIDLVLAHGSETIGGANSIGGALAMFSLGLPGFCTFLYMTRVLQSMQDTRTAFVLYLAENIITIAIAFTLVGPLGLRGLALSVSIAYSAASIMALVVVRRRLGGVGGGALTRPLKRTTAATVMMAMVTVLAVNISNSTSGAGLMLRVGLAVVVGGCTYVAVAAVLGAREARRILRMRVADQVWKSVGRPAPRSDQDDKLRPRPSSFRGRLPDEHTDPAGRHLRPVSNKPGGDDEEEFHGPGKGGDR